MSNQPKYKLLDCERKAVLGLPSGAVHLWLVYYMHESEAQESYLSLSRLELITGWDRKTVIKWRDYLKEKGWLIETGDHASDRYTKPTQGSHRVPVVRVDDPNKGSGKIPLQEKSGSGEFLGGKIPPKVYGYGSSSSSLSPSDDAYPTSTDKGMHRLAAERHGENQKPQTKTNRKSVAPDGTSWPEWDAHDQVWKTAKLIELGKTKAPAVPVSEYLEELDGPSAPPSKEKTNNQNPVVFCFQCKLEPVRSKTSDYCTHCWERRKPKLPALPDNHKLSNLKTFEEEL